MWIRIRLAFLHFVADLVISENIPFEYSAALESRLDTSLRSCFESASWGWKFCINVHVVVLRIPDTCFTFHDCITYHASWFTREVEQKVNDYLQVATIYHQVLWAYFLYDDRFLWNFIEKTYFVSDLCIDTFSMKLNPHLIWTHNDEDFIVNIAKTVHNSTRIRGSYDRCTSWQFDGVLECTSDKCFQTRKRAPRDASSLNSRSNSKKNLFCARSWNSAIHSQISYRRPDTLRLSGVKSCSRHLSCQQTHRLVSIDGNADDVHLLQFLLSFMNQILWELYWSRKKFIRSASGGRTQHFPWFGFVFVCLLVPGLGWSLVIFTFCLCSLMLRKCERCTDFL